MTSCTADLNSVNHSQYANMTSEESHEFTHPACPDFDQSHTGQFGRRICEKYCGYTDVEVLSDTIFWP